MPKIKTNRAASKRFKRTKSGQFKRHKQGARHLMNCKSAKRKRNLRKPTLVDSTEIHRLKVMLPYA